jgi:predicted XRE-type DNA-binding protein
MRSRELQRMLRKLKDSGANRRTERQQVRRQAAKNVISALVEAGLSQCEIAEYLGVTQAAVSNNMNGVTTASVATLVCLVSLAQERNVKLPEMSQWREL